MMFWQKEIENVSSTNIKKIVFASNIFVRNFKMVVVMVKTDIITKVVLLATVVECGVVVVVTGVVGIGM